MKRALLFLAAATLLTSAALAGPEKTVKAKAPAAVADCPHATAKCGDCPSAKKAAPPACAECPSAKKAECPEMSKAGKDMVKVKCGTGTKTANVAKLTAAKKYVDYKGKRYYFVCDHCPTDFKKNPDAYAKRHTGFVVATAKVSSKAKPKK